MSASQLSDLFKPLQEIDAEGDSIDKVVFLHYKYGEKYFCTTIDRVKEIIDFPFYVPFPIPTENYLGIFNLRGTIIPIYDPQNHLLTIEGDLKSRAREHFRKMKLRLIVFELDSGELLALPVSEVGKMEFDESVKQEKSFLEINGRPYEFMDITSIVARSR